MQPSKHLPDSNQNKFIFRALRPWYSMQPSLNTASILSYMGAENRLLNYCYTSSCFSAEIIISSLAVSEFFFRCSAKARVSKRCLTISFCPDVQFTLFLTKVIKLTWCGHLKNALAAMMCNASIQPFLYATSACMISLRLYLSSTSTISSIATGYVLHYVTVRIPLHDLKRFNYQNRLFEASLHCLYIIFDYIPHCGLSGVSGT